MSSINSISPMQSTSKAQLPLTPGAMKQLVSQIDDQIVALQTQVDLAQTYQEVGLDDGYQRQIDFASWIEQRRDKFDGGNVPTLNAIAFVKSILDVLVEADKPLTERAIKTLCTPYCKDLGVRVTMKGGIVGQILDVNMVCGILEALGLVEVKVDRMAKSEVEAEKAAVDHLGRDGKIDMERYKSRNEDVPLCKMVVDKWQWLLDTYLKDILNKKGRGPTGKAVGRPSAKNKKTKLQNNINSSSGVSNCIGIDTSIASSSDVDNNFSNTIGDADLSPDTIQVKSEDAGDDSFEKGDEYEEEDEEEEEIEGDEEDDEEGEEEEDEDGTGTEVEDGGVSDEASGDNVDDSLEEQEGSGEDEDGTLEGDGDGSDLEDGAEDVDMVEVKQEVREEKAPVTISSMLGSMMPRSLWGFGSSSSSQKAHDPATPSSSSSSIIKKEKKTVTEDDDTVSTDSGFKESPEIDNAKKSKDGLNIGIGRGSETIAGDKRATVTKTISLVDRTKNPVVDNTVDAETFYLDMSQTVYDEALALEQEEGVLRRLAGQCGITIPSSSSYIPGVGAGNFRVGTNYLSSKYRHSAGGHHKRWDCDVPMTGAQLWAKAKANAPKKKFEFKSSIAWGSTHPIFDEAGKQSGTGRLRSVNYDNVFDRKHFIEPAYLKTYDPLMMPLPPAPPYSTCKPTGEQIVMPDLLIRTSAIPWSSIAAEFVPYEEDHMDDGMDFDAIHSGEIKKKKKSGVGRGSGRRKIDEVEGVEEEDEEDDDDESDESDDESVDHPKPPPLVRSASTGIDLIAPSFREITPVVYGVQDTGIANKNKKAKVTSKDDSDSEEDIRDETIERRHDKGLAEMREKWQTISKLKEELRGEKMAMGRGGNGMMKFGVGGSPGRKKRRVGRPSKQGNPNWIKNADGTPSPRKRGRPPSKNIPIPAVANNDPSLVKSNP